jgi:type IV secretory pathway protease TraF
MADLRLGWLKQIVALAGDEVCWRDGHIFVNQQDKGELTLVQDYPLPVPSICQTLGDDDVLSMGAAGRSFDDRYTGPLKREEIHDLCHALF